ncbi:MAG: hypothetical protein PUP93_33585, partial [Rhizonema sp. NSF051]|nr:hypothetical protein [Rhizonema sp. NSF051]
CKFSNLFCWVAMRNLLSFQPKGNEGFIFLTDTANWLYDDRGKREELPGLQLRRGEYAMKTKSTNQ